MSTSQAVALHLPFLRRYARALTGSQGSGDSYVAATLEALIGDPGVLDGTLEPRVALYRLFTKIWNSVSVNNAPDLADRGLPIDQRIAQITSRPRQAFLLIALEGFSEADAAKILDVDTRELTQLVEESGRELAAEIATDVLIIEDEPFIAMDLEGLVAGARPSRHRHRAHACGSGRARQAEAARPHPGRYPAGGRQFGSRCRQRIAAHLRGAGDFHHRLSGALSHG